MYFRPVLLPCRIFYYNVRIIYLQILLIKSGLFKGSGYRTCTHFPLNSLFYTWEYNNRRRFALHFYILIWSHFTKLSSIYLISKCIIIHRSVVCGRKCIHNLIYHVFCVEIYGTIIFYDHVVHVIISPVRPNIFKS